MISVGRLQKAAPEFLDRRIPHPHRGDLTVIVCTMAPAVGAFDLICQVNDVSGAPNAKNTSPTFNVYPLY